MWREKLGGEELVLHGVEGREEGEAVVGVLFQVKLIQGIGFGRVNGEVEI